MLRIGSVVIDCHDFASMARFWQAALGYVPREAPQDGWVVLCDPGGPSVNVSLNRVPEPRAAKGRLHLDLYAEDRDAEVERLLALGATRPAQRAPGAAAPGEDFVVLADPEGNLFCVVEKRGNPTAVQPSQRPRMECGT